MKTTGHILPECLAGCHASAADRGEADFAEGAFCHSFLEGFQAGTGRSISHDRIKLRE
jgi:hypothetical protein